MFKHYKLLPMPEGMAQGSMFNNASTKQLDIFGDRLGVKGKGFYFYPNQTSYTK